MGEWKTTKGRRRAVGLGQEEPFVRLAFTLVELLYVVVLLGLLAAVAAPLVDVDRFRLNAAVTTIATELMAAQRTAVLRGHNVVVALDSAGNRIRVHADANNDRAIQDGEGWKWVELPEGVRFGLSGHPPPGGGIPLSRSSNGRARIPPSPSIETEVPVKEASCTSGGGDGVPGPRTTGRWRWSGARLR